MPPKTTVYDTEHTQTALIFLNSPLNLLAKFALFMQERFSSPSLPWQYDADENKTQIFVQTAYDKNLNTSNTCPQITIERGTLSQGEMVQGDLHGHNPHVLSKDATRKYGRVDVDIRIHCASTVKGECEVLGDIVQTSIRMSMPLLRRLLKIHDISAVALQPVRPYEHDKERWATTVEFRLMFEAHWFEYNQAPELRSVSILNADDQAAWLYIKKKML